MTPIIRLDENDLIKMVMEQYDVKLSEITSYYTEECRGYGMGEHTEPIFYIEVKINNKGDN